MVAHRRRTVEIAAPTAIPPPVASASPQRLPSDLEARVARLIRDAHAVGTGDVPGHDPAKFGKKRIHTLCIALRFKQHGFVRLVANPTCYRKSTRDRSGRGSKTDALDVPDEAHLYTHVLLYTHCRATRESDRFDNFTTT